MRIYVSELFTMNKDEQGLTHISKITHLKQTLFDVILLYSKGRNIIFLPRKITSRLLLSHAANNPHTISQPSLVTAPPARLLKSDCASSATAMEGGTQIGHS